MIIGIAGGIGSGKSTVAGILRDLGCIVTHSDEDGRAALRDAAIRDELVSWWGRDILDESGEIDRAALARIVFADPVQRQRLETLTHPWIESRRREQWKAAPPGRPAFVIDAPLLFEAGIAEQCDAVVFVDVDRAERLRRVATTRGWDDTELARREDSQMPLDAKQARADYVIENNGDLERLNAEVRRILIEIVRSHGEQAHE